MNISMTVNSRYMRYMYVMLTSLFENNDNGPISLLILERDFTDSDKSEIVKLGKKFDNDVDFYHVDDEDFLAYPKKFMREILFRLKMPEYCPNDWDRVLMLDVDLIVNGDLTELYNLDFQGNYMAVAQDMFGKGVVWRDNRKWYPADRKDWTHYNTGVLLYNLRKLREDFPTNYLFDKGLESGIEIPTFEEELFNILFGEQGILPIQKEKWNYMPGLHAYDICDDYVIYDTNEELVKNARIMHFAQQNPWDNGKKTEAFKIWWDYAKKTPFYEELLWESYWKAEDYIAPIEANMEDNEHKLRYIDEILDRYEDGSLISRFEVKGYHEIIIYGASRMARILATFLRDSKIVINCFIDRDRTDDFCGKKVIGLDAVGDINADCIIVSNPAYYDEVKAMLENYTNMPIISIEELINNN